MRIQKSRGGFSLVEIVLVLVVVGVIALLGYTFYDRLGENKTADNEQTQSATAKDVPDAPEVNDAGDLDAALSTLDEINPGESGDASTLDGELNAF